jgi:copper resistance protein C
VLYPIHGRNRGKKLGSILPLTLNYVFGGAEVRNEQGVVMNAGKATVVGGTQLRVPVKTLPPGTYKVIWRVLSVDTHRTQGDFTFRVGQ